MNYSLPPWSSTIKPLYDIKKSYLENFQQGPQFNQTLPQRLPSKTRYTFLNHRLRSKIGVAAGPLLCSQWIALAAQLGFDLVTYKTIRSHKHPSHPLPNMLYVDVIKKQHRLFEALKKDHSPCCLSDLAVTNSFGMPSMDREFLLQDIEKAHASLSEGQAMVVSIVGTPSPSQDLFQDFVEAAALAKDAGATIIEANFSCPNVTSKEGSIYTDPSSVYTLGSMLKKYLGSIPLIIKVGYLSSQKQIENLAIAAAKANVDAISGINTMSMEVKTAQGQPALGENRLKSGICGAPIKEFGLEFISKLSQTIKKKQLPLTLIGVGGVTCHQDFEDYLQVGSDAVQTASGMMWDPLLAMRYHNQGSFYE